MMSQDNRWHPAVVVKGPKFFGIYNTAEEAMMMLEGKCSGELELNEVKWNWNSGQPLLDFGDFMAACVDTSINAKNLEDYAATVRGVFKVLPDDEAKRLRSL